MPTSEDPDGSVVASNETGRTPSEAMVTLYGVSCCSTLGLMALTERFEDLPGAVAAFASAWYILRF